MPWPGQRLLKAVSIYKNQIRGWFDERLAGENLTPLHEAALAGDAETMEEEIAWILMESISYMDNKQAFYHGLLAGIFKGMKWSFILKKIDSILTTSARLRYNIKNLCKSERKERDDEGEGEIERQNKR